MSLWQVRNGNVFNTVKGFRTRGNIMDSMKYFCAVIAYATGIANTDGDPFKYDEPLLVLKGLTVNFLRTHGALAVLA